MSNWLELKHHIEAVDHATYTLREVNAIAEDQGWTTLSGHIIDKLLAQLTDTKNSLLTELSECRDAALASPYYAQAMGILKEEGK